MERRKFSALSSGPSFRLNKGRSVASVIVGSPNAFGTRVGIKEKVELGVDVKDESAV